MRRNFTLIQLDQVPKSHTVRVRKGGCGRRVNRHGPIDANDPKGMRDPERSIQTITANMA